MIEFEHLLKDQPLVKVVLNGGHQELDDSTVPFTLRFGDEIADKKPTHVLVISLPYRLYSHLHYKKKKVSAEVQENPAADNFDPIEHVKRYVSKLGTRKIYDLSITDYIQFHEPGKHNLLFILYREIDKNIRRDIMQEGDDHLPYQNEIDLNYIEDHWYYQKTTSRMCGYCEALVDIPEQFFATTHKSGIRKLWWEWVNRWHDTTPVDECAFRKRVPLALTIQALVCLFGIMARLLFTILMTIALPFFWLVLILCGFQLPGTSAVIRSLYQKYVLFQRSYKLKAIVSDYGENGPVYKNFIFRGEKYEILISPVGICLQLLLWFYYGGVIATFFRHMYHPGYSIVILFLATVSAIAATWHVVLVLETMPECKLKTWYKNNFFKCTVEEKVVLSSLKVWTVILWLSGIAALFYLITQIHLISTSEIIVHYSASIFYSIYKLLIIAVIAVFVWKYKKIKEWFFKTDYGHNILVKKREKEMIRIRKMEMMKPDDKVRIAKPVMTAADWYKQNMNINSVPAKVNTEQIIAPTRAKQVILFFKVGFWSAKSKVCKPYARI